MPRLYEVRDSIVTVHVEIPDIVDAQGHVQLAWSDLVEGNTSIWNSIKSISARFNAFEITALRYLNSGEEFIVQTLLGRHKKWHEFILENRIVVVVQRDVFDEISS